MERICDIINSFWILEHYFLILGNDFFIVETDFNTRIWLYDFNTRKWFLNTRKWLSIVKKYRFLSTKPLYSKFQYK